MIHHDFETRSFCDLLTEGGYKYASDPTTEVTMMAFAFDDDEPEIWLPLEGEFWDRLRAAITERGVAVHKLFPMSITYAVKDGKMMAAHNAQFERLMFEYVICPDFDVEPIPLESFYCTATQARANGLPATLDGASRALGSGQLKDQRGKELIKALCVPHDGKFIEELEQYIEFVMYCLQDVKTERAIAKVMRPLTDSELDEYVASEIINDRGLMIDRELAQAAVAYASDEQQDLIDEIQRITKGAVVKARGKNMTNWVYERLAEPQQKHMHKYKNGEQRLSLDRNARERIILDPETPALVKQVVEYSDFAQASSTSKFQAMLNRADPEDDRVRGSFIFNGASQTGRFSARGLQPHNFPRDSLTDPEDIACALIDNDSVDDIEKAAGHSIMQVLKRLLRHSIIAREGYTFVCGDWSQVEGRALPWLSIGTSPATDVFAWQKLEEYANQTHEDDVYCKAASNIYGYKVTRDGTKKMENCRQIGKVGELSLGFGGGVGAFQAMAGGYGVHVHDTLADQIKTSWRKGNPWAQPFWNALHNAAVSAVRNPNTAFSAGRIQYLYQPGINRGCLWALLPCGRVLAYPYAKVEFVGNRYGGSWELSCLKAAWSPKSGETEWPRVNLWPGLLAENVTQGFCGSLLREALVQLVFDYDAPVAGHTHDEALLEVPEDKAEYWKGILNRCMLSGSKRYEGLPLDCDIWIGPNYRK